jgi:hypothetical protein
VRLAKTAIFVPVSSQQVQRAGSGSGKSSTWRALTVLAMGTDDWGVEQAASSLVAAGHRTLRCHEPGEPAFPCNALIPGRTCPLDEGFDVAVTVRARPLPQPSQSEFGVVCALRIHVPVVVAGMTAVDPFEPWATVIVDPGGDITTACEDAAPMLDLRDDTSRNEETE